MPNVHLTLLSPSDHSELLHFEKINQRWFEATIPPRDAIFYTNRGAELHIEECLELYEKDEMLPMLIKDEKECIIGRINLHSLCLQSLSAHLGYRIAQSEIGKGVATKATKALLTFCQEKYSLSKLIAITATGNLASQRVLTNNQFSETRTHKNYTRLNGKLIHCIEYQKLWESGQLRAKR
ncbi:GNAT family N-acetyltransferase [Vibrio amylolyticus]|uniref:GNAT family N-acetyltransferase n=1 Tax=Vibrio amylolyticus TaxID=2847292 RepID=UPI0035540DBF